ncbi:MAG TPA: hypothetical protein VEU62_17710 [Bryobacterales bacterium]|nr:hypothetical protein [Bryobacterales bacterium]
MKETESTGTLDFGYRWVLGQGGSRDLYRSLVNLGEGPKLFGADLSLRRPSGRLYDRFDLHASSWGGDPYNTARLDASRSGLYDFRFDYRNVKYFNAIPSFANALVGNGVLFSERSLDTSNRLIETELDLLPGAHFSPYLAYYHSSNFGRGVTTFVDDNVNEFPVVTDLRDATDSYRGGVHVNFSRFNLTLEQGGTTFKDDQQVGFSGLNPGDRRVPFLGQTILLRDLHQAYGARGNGIFERAVLQGRPATWLNFTGQFLYSKPSIDVNYLQQDSGNFVLLNTLQIYTGQLDRSIGEANRPHSSGTWSTEIRPFKRVRIVESWFTDRFHIAAGSFLGETLTAAAGLLNTTSNAADRLVLNYNQHEVDAIVDVASFLTLRGGHRYEWGDATTRSPVTVDTLRPEQASLGRQIALAGAVVRLGSNLDFNADFETAAADRTFFRTDLANYQRARLRGRYRMSKSLSATGSFAIFNNQNPARDVNLDFQSRQTSLALIWTPGDGKRWSLLADYTRGTVRSAIPYLVPQDRTSDVSFYRDNGHYSGAAADLRLWGNARLHVGGAFALDAGSRPTRYFQPQMRAIVPIYKKLSWTAEWSWFGFDERLFGFENFHAHLFSTGLRIGM